MKTLFTIVIMLILLSFTGCQESASSNKNTQETLPEASLKYPLKTGQGNIFTYEDISTNPPGFYNDDGYYRKGYTRAFNNLGDGTVYNSNYDLYWQDNNASVIYDFSEAEDTCEDLDLGGKTNWRLPNVYELTTLLNFDSRADLRENSFKNMPSGYYFTSQNISKLDQTVVVGFGNNAFTVRTIDKQYLKDINESSYGILVSTVTAPKYNSNWELQVVTNTKIYYDKEENLQTTVGSITNFNKDGIRTTTTKLFTQVHPSNPPKVEALLRTYVKCVSGKEIGGFHFIRDARNEVVSDSATGLMWQDSPDVIQKKYKWGEAAKYCHNLTWAGYDDWRLPTISELLTTSDFTDSGTYSVNNTFVYRTANRFDSSSNSCYTDTCYQKNYQLNTNGYLPQKVLSNIEIDANPYDNNNSEPSYKARCVRGGSYN